jgi:hypothetical protein
MKEIEIERRVTDSNKTDRGKETSGCPMEIEETDNLCDEIPGPCVEMTPLLFLASSPKNQ